MSSDSSSDTFVGIVVAGSAATATGSAATATGSAATATGSAANVV